MRWLAILVTCWAVLFAVPTSYWFETHSLSVSDAEEGQAPRVREARTIHRGFVGLYMVEVRRVPDGDLACYGFGLVPYRGGQDGTRDLALTTWAGGDPDCRKLPPGQYRATVQRRIAWFAFLRGPRAESNIFTVRAAG